ncbi:MAG: hypothetical protein IKQ99_00075 [Alphaproteobacteria bacterium]|nr:hypothetical protein [Alphaproteobacteria bacterium]
MEAIVVATIAASLGSAYYTKVSYDRQRKAVKSANRSAKENARLQDEQAKLALAEQQRKNRNLLRQQQATYKANLGALGTSNRSGSGQTYLNALQREYDIEDKYLQNQAKISSDALLNSLGNTTNTNLLRLNSLNSESRLNSINSLGNIATGLSRTMIK